jgi:hypothetical protein
MTDNSSGGGSIPPLLTNNIKYRAAQPALVSLPSIVAWANIWDNIVAISFLTICRSRPLADARSTKPMPMDPEQLSIRLRALVQAMPSEPRRGNFMIA